MKLRDEDIASNGSSEITRRDVHVYDSKGQFIGRLDIQTMRGIEGWKPNRKLIKVIEELRSEGRL